MRKIVKEIARRLRIYLLQPVMTVIANTLPISKRRFLIASPVFSGILFGQEKGLSPNEADFLYLFVRMCRPKIVLETGACSGYSTSFIACALAENKTGHCYTFEINPLFCGIAKANLRKLGLKKWVTLYEGDTRENIRTLIADNKISQNLDLVFLDSGTAATIEEFETLAPHIKAGSGYLICHDVFQPRQSGKGVILYPYIRDKYPKDWDICVFRTGAAGFMAARKRGSGDCDGYKSLDSYNIKDFQDYLTNWLPKIANHENRK